MRRFIIAGLGLLAISWGAIISDIVTPEEEVKVIQIEEPPVAIKVVPIPQAQVQEEHFETELTEEEKQMIAGVVWCEAGNQDMIGKRLVADTVLNRVGRPGFAPTVYGVIHQPYQFAVGTYYDDACMEAVEKEMQERLDYKILWFRTEYFHSYGTPAYQHGDHFFSWGD